MNQQVPGFDHATPAPDGLRFSAAVAQAVKCDASEWGIVAVTGADAGAFLQAQLSSDVRQLSPGSGQWTTYNSPKGRMLASGFLWRATNGQGFTLALAADIAATVAKRLAMYVLRAKVTIVDRTATTVRIGVCGPAALGAVEQALDGAPSAGHAIERDGATIIALPDTRVLIVAAPNEVATIGERLERHATVGDAEEWRRQGVLAGVALISSRTQDLLLPQAANMDLLGAVALNPVKGCFPGQEIIKRTQALGQLKERLFGFDLDVPAPAPATSIFGATFGTQSCGVVAAAANRRDGGAMLLAVVQIRAAEADVLHLGAPDGPILSLRPLPYEVPVALAPVR